MKHSLVDIVVAVGVDAVSFRTGELNALAVSIMWGLDAVGSGIVNFATNVPLMLWIRKEIDRRVHLLLGLIGSPHCDHRQHHVKRLLVPHLVHAELSLHPQRSFDASSTIQILFSRVAFGRPGRSGSHFRYLVLFRSPRGTLRALL